jgi:23S rRNA (guanosine2251-2'-O)-methyltransferase
LKEFLLFRLVSNQNVLEEKQEIVFGRNPVLELLSSDKQVDKIWIDRKMSGDFEMEIRKVGKDNLIPIVRVPSFKLSKIINNNNHQGVIAFTTAIKYLSLKDFLELAKSSKPNPVILLLDRITDVRNLGAISRSALWFDAQGLVIPMKNTAPISPEAIKTSAGALIHLPICRVSSLMHIIDDIQKAGFKVFSTSLKVNKPCSEMNFNQPTAIVLGSEEHGVSREIVARSDDTFLIPGTDKIDSLNVAVSAGIIMYEVYTQQK